MTAVTHTEFDDKTTGREVAAAFPDAVRGKSILVTGVNRQGVGFAISDALASQSPAHIILAGRSSSKIKECINALKESHPGVDFRPLQLDLSSQKSVRAAASELLSWSDIPAINILVNNAAVMMVQERTITEDGIELHFATNHIGHFLFTCLIMPKLLASAKESHKGATRVVNISSLSPTVAGIRWSDVNFEKVNKTLPKDEQPPYEMLRMWGAVDPEEKAYMPLEGYNQSKVGNILFGIALNERLHEKYGILSIGCHPGVIATELGRHIDPVTRSSLDGMFKKRAVSYRPLEAAASTGLVAALDAKLGLPEARGSKQNYGSYLIDCQISDLADPRADSTTNSEKLWKLSEKLVNENFTF